MLSSLRPPLVFWLFRILVDVVAFLLIGVALNMIQVLGLVFLSHFYGVDLSSWVASLPVIFVLVFFGGLGLRLTCVSRREIVGLSFVSILILPILPISFVIVLFCQSIALWAPKIDFSYS